MATDPVFRALLDEIARLGVRRGPQRSPTVDGFWLPPPPAMPAVARLAALHCGGSMTRTEARTLRRELPDLARLLVLIRNDVDDATSRGIAVYWQGRLLRGSERQKRCGAASRGAVIEDLEFAQRSPVALEYR